MDVLNNIVLGKFSDFNTLCLRIGVQLTHLQTSFPGIQSILKVPYLLLLLLTDCKDEESLIQNKNATI